MSEREVQRAILGYLCARRILAFRMQTGAHVAENKGRQRLIRYGAPGMADVLAFPLTAVGAGGVVIEGIMPLWIECKSAKGQQTPAQLSFQKIVEDNGHAYIVARSIDDVEKWLKERGA